MRELIFSATKKDFRVDTFCSGGPGGQHQNKTRSGVRITHIPTGISAECREERHQGVNKKRAWDKLCQLLVQYVKNREAKKYNISTEVIRTYNEPDNRVKDNVSGLTKTYDEVIIDGNESGLIEARRNKLQ